MGVSFIMTGHTGLFGYQAGNRGDVEVGDVVDSVSGAGHLFDPFKRHVTGSQRFEEVGTVDHAFGDCYEPFGGVG